MGRLRTALTLAAALAAVLVAAPVAQAAKDEESTFQDDSLLVYNTPDGVAKTLDTLKALGVDRIRVSVFWKIVAPGPNSKTEPNFDATDPAAYPNGSWDRYDTVVKLAQARGIAVHFNITSPAPLWATGSPDRKDIEATYNPDPKKFGEFVRAVGTRYSGTYSPPQPAPPPDLLPMLDDQPPPPPTTPPFPRVDYWSIWNEPNQSGWLTPQWVPDPRNAKNMIEASPQIYRGLLDAAYDALVTTGHQNDTILVGETAPKGLLDLKGETRSMDSLHFIRQLYCLDDNLQFLQGSSAQVRGCPVSDQGKNFTEQHPVLFHMTGWAHHPYELTFAPNRKPRHADRWVTIANLPVLSRQLQRIFQRYGQPLPAGGMPLYLTEFGYQTNPPDPLGVSPRKQAIYLNQAEYIAYRNVHVRSLNQFLLVDDKPLPGFGNNKVAAYGGTFQSGLAFQNGTHKPAFNTYALPLWLPKSRIRPGRKLGIWGLVRVAPNGAAPKVAVQWRGRGRKSKFRVIAVATGDAARGYVNTKVSVPGSGQVRLIYVDPAGLVHHSRAASFTER